MVTKRTGIVKDGVRPCFLRGGHMKKGLGTGIRSGLLGLVAICALGANAFSVKAEAEKIVVSLDDTEGKPYAIVEFQHKKQELL